MTLQIHVPNSAVIEVFDVLIDRDQYEKDSLEVCHERIQRYLEVNWGTPKIQRLVRRIRRRSRVRAIAANTQDPFDIVRAASSTSFKRESNDPARNLMIRQIIVQYCALRFELRPPVNSPEYLLQSWIQKEALADGHLRPQLFYGVSELLHRWRMKQFVKLFALHDGPVQDTWTLLRQTNQGDVSALFNNCVQLPIAARVDPAFYRSLVTLLRDRATNILFVHSKQDQVAAAAQAKLDCVWVRRLATCSNERLIIVQSVDSIVQIQFLEGQDGSRTQDRACC